MVEREPSKLDTRVRFPSPAPFLPVGPCSSVVEHSLGKGEAAGSIPAMGTGFFRNIGRALRTAMAALVLAVSGAVNPAAAELANLTVEFSPAVEAHFSGEKELEKFGLAFVEAFYNGAGENLSQKFSGDKQVSVHVEVVALADDEVIASIALVRGAKTESVLDALEASQTGRLAGELTFLQNIRAGGASGAKALGRALSAQVVGIL